MSVCNMSLHLFAVIASLIRNSSTPLMGPYMYFIWSLEGCLGLESYMRSNLGTTHWGVTGDHGRKYQ